MSMSTFVCTFVLISTCLCNYEILFILNSTSTNTKSVTTITITAVISELCLAGGSRSAGVKGSHGRHLPPARLRRWAGGLGSTSGKSTLVIILIMLVTITVTKVICAANFRIMSIWYPHWLFFLLARSLILIQCLSPLSHGRKHSHYKVYNVPPVSSQAEFLSRL